MDLELAQHRAIASVQRLTGLDVTDARHVVVDGTHWLYDAERPSALAGAETFRRRGPRGDRRPPRSGTAGERLCGGVAAGGGRRSLAFGDGVADALTALVEEGPAAGRAVQAVQQAVPTCHRCGGDAVPVIYGMPGGDLMAWWSMGVISVGGCVIPDTGLPDPDLGACRRCGEQRLLTLQGDAPRG
jgi:hypothetical protein